ncbi:hypothetical protein Ga0100231_005345 [Opitutaceae bacterium TAV4]|nr:hypothetical protein Ga0100231_005345 [Opitutaceae bacterium TAV4]RRK02588.1 hypothetical protein Ga0100230_005595 [Opitutaceae bacterium TAV3]
MDNSSIIPIVIEAGKMTPINQRAHYVQILNAVGTVEIRVDAGSPKPLLSGQGLHCPEGFSRLEFRNPAGVRTEFNVWVGNALFIDQRIDQIEAHTEMIAPANGGSVIIQPNGSVDLPGTPDVRKIRRKAVVVSNTSNELYLEFRDASGGVTGIVRANETITHHVSGFVRIHNPQTAPLAATISEIWWTA